MGGWVRRLGAIVAAVLAVLLCSATPAVAANQKDMLQAGWFGSTTSFTQARARITVPAITCPASVTADYSIAAQWSAEFTLASVAVVIHCENGVVSTTASAYEFSLFAGTKIKQFDVSQGDVVSASFSYNAATGVARVIGKNVTTTDSVTVAQTVPGLTWTTAAYFLQRVDFSSPVFTFTTIPFQGLTIDGQPAETALDASLVAKNLFNGTNKLVQTQAFNPAGAGFRLKFIAEL